MKVIAKLIAAGVDPDLVSEVAQAIADAQSGGEKSRTLRQERNARYYSNRLNKTVSDDDKTIKTIKTIKTVSDNPSRARETEANNLDPKIISYQKDPLKGVQKGKVLSHSTGLAEDAQPSDKDRAVADRVGMDEATFRTEWIRFRGHHVARGNRMKNWHQAWVTWAHGWRPHARAGPGGVRKPTMAEMARMDEPGFSFDAPRTHDPFADQPTGTPEPRASGFAGRLSLEDHARARRHVVDL